MTTTTERFSPTAPEASIEPASEIATPTTEEVRAIVEGPVTPRSGLHRVADILSRLAETHDHASALWAARNDQDRHADVTDNLVKSAESNQFSRALLSHEERVADVYDTADRIKEKTKGILRGVGAATRNILKKTGNTVGGAGLVALGAGIYASEVTAKAAVKGAKAGAEAIKTGAQDIATGFKETGEDLMLGAQGFKEDAAKAANFVAKRANEATDTVIEKTLYGVASVGVAAEDAGKAMVEKKNAVVDSFNEKRETVKKWSVDTAKTAFDKTLEGIAVVDATAAAAGESIANKKNAAIDAFSDKKNAVLDSLNEKREAVKTFWQERKAAALKRKDERRAAREKRQMIRERAQNLHTIRQEHATEAPQAELNEQTEDAAKNSTKAVRYESPIDDIIANGPEKLDTSSPEYQEKLRVLADSIAIDEAREASTQEYRQTLRGIMEEVDEAASGVTEQPAKPEGSRNDPSRWTRYLGRRAAAAYFRTRNKARAAKEGWNNG